jgi:hypothetical protein
MKCLIALEAKQKEVARYHAIREKVNSPNHFGCGGEVGITSKLVKLLTFGKTLLLL